MAFQYFTSNDFESPGGKVMKLRKPGLVFVMFKTSQCQHCVNFEPRFKEMAQRELRVRFAIVDVQQFRQITGMAQTTNTPIRAVPMFILYLNGAPFARYKGKHDPNVMLSFLNTMVQKTGTVNNSPSSFVPKPPPNNNINYSQQDLIKNQQSSDIKLPDGVIPYNQDYLAYLPLNS